VLIGELNVGGTGIRGGQGVWPFYKGNSIISLKQKSRTPEMKKVKGMVPDWIVPRNSHRSTKKRKSMQTRTEKQGKKKGGLQRKYGSETTTI